MHPLSTSTPQPRSLAMRTAARRILEHVRAVAPFLITGIVLWLGTRHLAPWLERLGAPRAVAFSTGLYLPFAVLAAVAVALAWREAGRTGLGRRLRLRAPTRRGWGLTAATLVAVTVLEALLAPAAAVLSEFPGLGVPTTFPAPFDPLAPFSLPPADYLGTPLEGAAWLALLAVGGWLANIAGEELFWRGWLLPRQERVWGRWAWLPHGLGWLLLVHAFMPWAWVALLPTTLLVPWLAQHARSVWPAVVVHGTGNGIFAALVVIAVLR